MAKAYHIKDWDGSRENADTRKYVDLLWFRMRVKLVGEGLGHTLAQPERQGPFLYGMFKLIEQLAAGCQPRGWLIRNGTPMDAARMANLMRLPVTFFDEALTFFTTAPMDWLEHAEMPEFTPSLLPPSEGGRKSAGRLPGESPDVLPPSEGGRKSAGRLPGESPDVLPPSEGGRKSAGRLPGDLRHPKNERTKENELTDKREKKVASLEASKLQWSAVSRQIKELEGKGSGQTPADKQTLRRLRATLREIERRQGAGDFSTVQATGGDH